MNRHGFRTGWLIDSNEQPFNEADALNRGINAFGEQRVALRYPQLTLNAGLPISERRDYIVEQNGGSVTQSGGKYRVRASSQAGSVAKLTSRQRANYISGGELEGGIGLLADQPSGNAHIDWGFIDYDGSNAVRFSYKSDGVYLELVSGGTEIMSVPQSKWNMNTLDGFDPSVGHVYEVPFVYYGFGDIIFEVLVEDQGKQRTVPIHRINRTEEISIEKSNLPLSVEVYGDGQQLDCYVGGRQINSSLPDYGVDRTTGARRLSRSIGTDFRPLVSFQHKTGFEDIFLTLTGMNVITDVDAIIEIQRNATLDSNASFSYVGNYEETERATQWDVSAGDTFTSGQTMYEAMVVGGTGGQTADFNADVPQRPISEFDIITLAARTISGTGTMSASFKVNEHW